jgi:hypothetical protein
MSEFITPQAVSEEDVKLMHITPAILKKGWEPGKHFCMEHSFTAGRVLVLGSMMHRAATKSADYFLDDEIYYTQKFTTGFGGVQDLAYHDVIEYLEKGSIFYKVGAILDGTYWESGKRDNLKRYFANNPNVVIVSMDDIVQYKE